MGTREERRPVTAPATCVAIVRFLSFLSFFLFLASWLIFSSEAGSKKDSVRNKCVRGDSEGATAVEYCPAQTMAGGGLVSVSSYFLAARLRVCVSEREREGSMDSVHPHR